MKDTVKNSEARNETMMVGGVNLTLSSPDITDPRWIGQAEILKQVLESEAFRRPEFSERQLVT